MTAVPTHQISDPKATQQDRSYDHMIIHTFPGQACRLSINLCVPHMCHKALQGARDGY